MSQKTTTADDITAEVLRSFAATADPRLRLIMESLTRHLHAFVRDVELTEPEWFEAIRFLTETGHMCSDKRQEFILLSDALGVSMLVDLVAHPRPADATESTVLGPFHRGGAPDMPAGGNIAHLDPGPCPRLSVDACSTSDGNPIGNALLDVWQTASNGLYDSQDPSLGDALHMRGRFRTDTDGRYLIRTVRPVHYQIPSDGPVGSDAARDGKTCMAARAYPFRRFCGRLRAVDHAYLRCGKPVSRIGRGVRGQAVSHLPVYAARFPASLHSGIRFYSGPVRVDFN